MGKSGFKEWTKGLKKKKGHQFLGLQTQNTITFPDMWS